MLGGAILVIVLVLIFGVRACVGGKKGNSNEDQKTAQSNQENDPSSPANDGETDEKKDASPATDTNAETTMEKASTEVTELIQSYYKAFGEKDIATLKTIEDGFTPADLVFPAFMFIMGVSIYLSLNKSNFDWRISIARILRRAVLIFVSGVALKWILAFIATGEYNTLENLRIMGVLQRLGICYGIVALLAVTVRHRLFPTIIAVLLVGYYLLQLFGNGFEKCAGNIVSMVDYAVLGKSHMYLGGAQFVDPEGILSTIPAIAQVMIGFLCGKVIVGEKEIRSQIVKLAVWGTSMFVVGYLWSYAAPLNKRLWSPSFVLVTCGITSLIFATLIYIIDDSKRTRWSFPFLVVGVNPLSIYIFSEIAGGLFRKLQWTTISFEGIWQPLFGNYGGSLAYALAFLMFNWLIAFFLYKKHIYIKL